jgi:hypothetical protein
VRIIIGNDRTSPDLTACACRGGHRDEMRYIVGDKYITSNKIIILKKIFAVMNA